MGSSPITFGSKPMEINYKVQFDARNFNDPLPVIFSSDPRLMIPFRYDKVAKSFDVQMRFKGVISLSAVLLTSMDLNVEAPPGGTKNLWFSLFDETIDGEFVKILRIGLANPAGTAIFPEIVFCMLVLQTYNQSLET